ncbi:MAG: iron-containing alcohol dehydrogenase [Oligosphaeraceae bacterium]|nr:iron-containing alcohol dehydrogenase [Oligosphaeraceae bacterium]
MKNLTSLLQSYSDTRVAVSPNGWSAFEDLLASRRPTRIAAFTGEQSADRSGLWNDFAACCQGVGLCRFSAIPPEPDLNCIKRLTAFLRDCNADMVVALGGGSVMDAAKAAYLSAQTTAPVESFFGVNQYSDKNSRPLDTVICFPTTSGTGSEVTPYSNIVDRDAKVKRLIADPCIIPEYAFVLPEYTDGLPQQITLATGCDALAHLIEGFLNVGADANDALANARALAGIRLVKQYLPMALADTGGRVEMAIAATLGGMVIRHKSTGLPHLCSFSWFGRIDHGLAAIMLLPECWRYYLGNPAVCDRTMQLNDIFPGNTPEEVIASFRCFLDACGVPARIQGLPGLDRELMETTARSAGLNRMKLELAPRPVEPDNSYQVLLDILLRS